MELIQQLNEVVKDKDGIERPKLHRVIKNLITQATTAADEYDEDGNLVKEGAGDLAAIREIFDRLEGKPRQQITGPSRARISCKLGIAFDGAGSNGASGRFELDWQLGALAARSCCDVTVFMGLPPPSLRIGAGTHPPMGRSIPYTC
jgi:hypothetical protein